MTKIIQRHDTSTNWTSVNPILALGEMGIETDTNKFKFGDGVTNWTALAYASAEGGGADLSNYYTKEETYNQEEVDTLLDTKQDVLTPSDPIKIGTSTIGEPNNINIVGDKILPTTPMNASLSGVSVSGSTATLAFYKPEGTTVTTLDEAFNNTSYIDIPINLNNVFTDDYSETQSVSVTLGGITNFSNYYGYTAYIGNSNNGEFVPYIISYVHTGTGNTSQLIPQNVILASTPTLSKTSSKYTQWTSTATVYNTTTRYYSSTNSPKVVFGYTKQTNGQFLINSNWFNGTYQHNSQTTASATQFDLNTLRNCNVIRVVFFVGNSSSEYYPTVEDTKLLYNSVDTGWNIEDGIVTTYGISLKYDNQTIQVNANGELVANLDELGNEVNAIASQVSTNTTALGGNKIVSLTQAEYDGLATKDPNTVYIITDGPDGTYALSDLSNVPSTVTSIPPTSLTNFDGQWVNVGGNHLNTSTAVGTYTADLSEILPSDGYDYELLVGVTVNGQQSTFSATWVGSDICGLMQVGGCSGSTADSINTFIIPVGQGRYLTKEVRQVAPSNCYLTLWAYRRLGTNQ